ncbi:hypothetical protein ACE14D_05615 [Streptomyces sp. Act-28]
MRQEWSPEDVVACRTLVDGDWGLVANKAGTTRLGFCLMLKFSETEGRSPIFWRRFRGPRWSTSQGWRRCRRPSSRSTT